MIRALLIAACFVVMSAVPLHAQTVNPCTTLVTATTFNPTSVVMTIDEFTALIPDTTTFAVQEWVLGIFNVGVNPVTGLPVSSITLPRAGMVLVAGTADCYRATPAELVAIPAGTQFGVAKARRTLPDVAESAWSPNSNPFARLTALLAPRAVRITR